MTPELILAAIVLLPVIILMILRINAALVFLSLCLGSVLVQFVAPDANQFLALFSAHLPSGVDTGNNSIKIFLLLLPATLTSLFMIKTIKGSTKLLINLLPAIGAGLLIGLLVSPLLPTGLNHNILHSNLWTQMQQSQTLIVGTSSFLCLIVLWFQHSGRGLKRNKHHKN